MYETKMIELTDSLIDELKEQAGLKKVNCQYRTGCLNSDNGWCNGDCNGLFEKQYTANSNYIQILSVPDKIIIPGMVILNDERQVDRESTAYRK